MKKALVFVVAIGVICFAGNLYAAHSDHGCSNCHVPHKSGDPNDSTVYGVPLWSTAQSDDGLPQFDLYSSRSFDKLSTDIGQPDGASKLCLGCHDGSYLVFAQYLPDSSAIFDTTSLASSHPVSFTYDAALVTADPTLRATSASSGTPGGGTIEDELLDEQSKMQCNSCHDVHTSGIGDYLLRWEFDTETVGNEVMCRVCHEK